MTTAPAPLLLGRSALRGHKRRFFGTFLAVLLGVAFLSGTLVMGDTLRGSFDTMFGDATRGTAAVVRSADVVTVPGAGQGTRSPVSTSLAAAVEKVPGVAAAEPAVQGEGRLIGKDGKVVERRPGPALARRQLDHRSAAQRLSTRRGSRPGGGRPGRDQPGRGQGR